MARKWVGWWQIREVRVRVVGGVGVHTCDGGGNAHVCWTMCALRAHMYEGCCLLSSVQLSQVSVASKKALLLEQSETVGRLCKTNKSADSGFQCWRLQAALRSLWTHLPLCVYPYLPCMHP